MNQSVQQIERPTSIMFLPNGTAAVCGVNGQMPQYQTGYHLDTIDALAADGIDWRTIPERMGTPQNKRKPPPPEGLQKYQTVISRSPWSSGWRGKIVDLRGDDALVQWGDRTAGQNWVPVAELEAVL